MFYTNRENFLTELGKLLSFMKEEDRAHAVAMYSKMFDDAPDESELLKFLASPTTQAVKLARVYQGGGAESGYVETINAINEDLLKARNGAPVVLKNQISIFEDDSKPAAETPRRRPSWKDPLPEEESRIAAAAETAAAAAVAAPVILEAPQAASETVNVDDFMNEMKINDDISVALSSKEETKREPVPEPLPIPIPVPNPEEDEPAAPEPLEEKAEEPAAEAEQPAVIQTERKTNVFLMILYILFAVPITALLIVLALLAAVLILSIAATGVLSGGALLMAAFGGFSVFADIMIVLGVSLILIALGLLFLWAFIWMLGGAIPGIIKGAVNLGGKLCTKEVPAE